jgi:hypothetical protein
MLARTLRTRQKTKFPLTITNFEKNTDKLKGMYMVIFYHNKESGENLSTLYPLQMQTISGKTTLKAFDIFDYDITKFFNSSYDVPLSTIKTLVQRANEREFPNYTGVCQGGVSSDFISDQIRIDQNDTFMVLVDFDKPKQELVKGFIIARKYRQNDNTFSYYIDIICSEPGYGSFLIKWFINFLFERKAGQNITDVRDPSFNVSSLSLSALSTVLYYYPIFGYMHVHACPSVQEDAITFAKNSVPKDKRDTNNDQFIKFLFILTKKGFNSNDDSFCVDMSEVVDTKTENVVKPENLSEEKLATHSTYIERIDDLSEDTRNIINSSKQAYDKAYKEFMEVKDNEFAKSERIKNMFIQKKKEYFDAAFNYAKNLYLHVSGCDGYGYKMMKC